MPLKPQKLKAPMPFWPQRTSSLWTSVPGLVVLLSRSPCPCDLLRMGATLGRFAARFCARFVPGRADPPLVPDVPGDDLVADAPGGDPAPPAGPLPPAPPPPAGPPPLAVAVSGPRHRGRAPRFCEDPCPCCYYTASREVNGEYTVGWRLFGGYWSWWHKGAPHALKSWENPDLGCNDPGVPRCPCCYYNFMEGVPLEGPGWYAGEWSESYGSWTWQWCGTGAPHAPGPNGGGSWSDVQDDARFMQWLTLDDNWNYVPRPEPQPAAASSSDAAASGSAAAASGNAEEAPGADDPPGDVLEEAQLQSAVLESLMDQTVEPSTESQPGQPSQPSP